MWCYRTSPSPVGDRSRTRRCDAWRKGADFLPQAERYSLMPAIDRWVIRETIVCFEIAETAALAVVARTARFLAGIRASGCGTALEDFGRGMASFTYLKALPVDFLKIGGQVVRDIEFAQGHALTSPLPLTDPDGRLMMPRLQPSGGPA